MTRYTTTCALAAFGALVLNTAPAPAQAPPEPWVGEIAPFAGSWCPNTSASEGRTGWAPADGNLLPIARNEMLFSLFGTTFGGDGRSTFGLPDLRGRMAAGAGGALNWAIGDKPGQPTQTLGAAHMPAHRHAFRAAGDGPTVRSPQGGAPATYPSNSSAYAPAADGPQMSVAMMSYTGGDRPFDLHQPYLVITYCVAVTGAWPHNNEEERAQ